ncbi:MAG: alpha/beta hydrolase [Firmicutes bacterium]|nr:alpha/beta hydrolase [Bacillota bacterium]
MKATARLMLLSLAGTVLLAAPQAAPTATQAPTVQVPAPAQEREVTFPGFNGFTLKGTVRPASGHGYFAVMVAGSGPTDRNWSNPLIRNPFTGDLIPSHGGRDFAAWLGQQGIASLRWDKRFIGSHDPKLDISLDAQSGDIRAAMAFARTLPEAKGKKLLLIGHSEGSLMALVTAKEADAVLLLAMPAQSMAKLVLEQVKRQLPPDMAKPNLEYLEAVFQAIRERQPRPDAGAAVLPALVTNLAEPLMRPESVGFVRDTLDLDPWLLASRIAVPYAVVWADRDVQTPRPKQVPDSFKGAVVGIAEANHLLKKETRDLGLLNGATAATTYGDDTPMADLKPLAEWLKTLK